MTTAIHIIEDALEMNGVYQPGEPITDADAQRSLIVLNDMLDQWSNDTLACYANLQQSVVLVNNKSAYTIGPSITADVNSKRPLAIDQAWLTDAQSNNYGIELLTQYDWNQIGNWQITSQIPTAAFYDPQDPIGILNFFPVPVMPLYTAHWMSYLQLTEFTSLTDVVTFPTGYVAALKSNLSMKLCKYFGVQLQADLKAEADETRATILRKNMKPQVSAYDREIRSRTGTGFNILSGGFDTRGGSP